MADVVAPGLRVLFCGINPGLYSGAVGHHFARPGNRFWPALHGSGFTAELLSPFAERRLLELGLGITNLVSRTTAAASELSLAELREGRDILELKVRRLAPHWLAVLGVDAFRKAFAEPRAGVGPQGRGLGATSIWVLPNPSGLNAHYQLPGLVAEFKKLFAQT